MNEESLDPKDPVAFRALAHRMVDDMLDLFASLPERPAWQPMPERLRGAFDCPVPQEPSGEAAAYADFVSNVLPYSNGNLHPRFWGWVQGNGTPLGMMADMLAAGMNPHMAGFSQAPALVEHQVIAWLAEMMGFPKEASGLLVSGGTMANTLGLAVARHAKAGFDIREEGVRGGERRLVFYGSTETHSWAKKAAELLGLGRKSFHALPTDDAGRMDVSALRARIDADTKAGEQPFCVIGTAGTVNTGATDDLHALADTCTMHKLWFHVDGAFGALAHLSPALRDRVSGLSRADSLGFDLHKWLYLPFESACVLVKDKDAHESAFRSTAPYIEEQKRGVIAGGLPFADRGLELTRSFKALKVWMSLRAYGVSTFARMVEQNVAQADYVAQRITAMPELSLSAPVALNVVCFRYVGKGVDASRLNDINAEILLRLQEQGIAVPSSTVMNGIFSLRIAIVNHRSKQADFDLLVDSVVSIGRELS